MTACFVGDEQCERQCGGPGQVCAHRVRVGTVGAPTRERGLNGDFHWRPLLIVGVRFRDGLQLRETKNPHPGVGYGFLFGV